MCRVFRSKPLPLWDDALDHPTLPLWYDVLDHLGPDLPLWYPVLDHLHVGPSLPLWDDVQGLYGKYPTQETCPRPCRLFSSTLQRWAIIFSRSHTWRIYLVSWKIFGRSWSGNRWSVRCVPLICLPVELWLPMTGRYSRTCALSVYCWFIVDYQHLAFIFWLFVVLMDYWLLITLLRSGCWSFPLVVLNWFFFCFCFSSLLYLVSIVHYWVLVVDRSLV